MALLRPGISENLTILPKSKINEHGTLELYIGSIQSENAELAAFENNLVDTAVESNFRFYAPNLTDFDKVVKSSSDIGKDLRKMRHQFMQYALIYATQEQVDNYIGGMKMFEGLGIPPSDYGKALKMLTNKDFLQKVVTNLSEQFLKFLTDSGAYTSGKTFRQKFLRQSKDKNYAVIPTSDYETWIEPMTILKEESKVAFSEWEIKNGKNNPNPASSSAASNTTAADVNTGKNLFNAPATPAPAGIVETPVTPSEAISPEQIINAAMGVPSAMQGTPAPAAPAGGIPDTSTPATPNSAASFFQQG